MPEIILREEDHKYFVDGRPMPGVNEILAGMGYQSVDFVPEVALHRGRYGHKTTELWDLGKLVVKSVRPDYLGYLEAWIKFREDTGFDPYHIEMKVYCPFPAPYCGQIDRIGWLRGGRCLLDIKTGKIGRCFPLKMVAYMKALPEGEPKPDSIASVVINKDGTYLLQMWTIGPREYALWENIACAWWGRGEYSE